jgi:hypothetical protein
MDADAKKTPVGDTTVESKLPDNLAWIDVVVIGETAVTTVASSSTTGEGRFGYGSK